MSALGIRLITVSQTIITGKLITFTCILGDNYSFSVTGIFGIFWLAGEFFSFKTGIPGGLGGSTMTVPPMRDGAISESAPLLADRNYYSLPVKVIVFSFLAVQIKRVLEICLHDVRTKYIIIPPLARPDICGLYCRFTANSPHCQFAPVTNSAR